MKKTLKGVLLAVLLLATFVLVPNKVSAASVLPEKVNGEITLTEDVTLTETFVVEDEVVLNLNGHTLDTTAGDTIYVKNTGTLTIKGDGTVTNNIHQKAPLFNNGITTIDGATLTRNDTAKTNTYYVILNHGTMTIKNATVTNPGVFSSLVANGYYDFTNTADERKGYVVGTNQEYPELTIDGGTFDGGMNTIKNDDNAIVTINDGTFKNSKQVSLQNHNEAYINGGTFETPTGDDKTNIYVGNAGSDSVNKGILVINGGTFNAEHLLEGPKGYSTAVEINGGTLNYTGTFFNEEKTTEAFKTDGVEIKGSVTAPVSAVVYAKDGSDITLNSELNIGDTITVPEGAAVYLPDEEVGKKVFVDNGDGTFTVAESADISKFLEVIDTIDKLEESDFTEESIQAFEAALEGLAEEIAGLKLTKDEQDQIDAITQKLEDAMNLLVKAREADETENPNTGDNVLLYAILALISAGGCGLIIRKKKLN